MTEEFDPHDLIDPHDLMDPLFDDPNDCDYYKYMELQENRYHSDTVYNDNGIQITACCSEQNYVIETDKYTVYWYTGGTLVIYSGSTSDSKSKILFEFKKEFDMSFFAKLFNANEPWSIEYASAEEANNKIEQFLNLKVFL